MKKVGIMSISSLPAPKSQKLQEGRKPIESCFAIHW